MISGPADPFMATVDGRRHEVYAELAARAPFHQVTFPTGTTGWVVTSHTATRVLLADSRVVKSEHQSGPFVDRLPKDVAAGIYSFMLYRNPPDHTRLRTLVSRAFTRTGIAALAPRISSLVDGLLDSMAGPGAVDLIAALAYPLPIGVISSLLGIPSEHEADFVRWSTVLIDPINTPYAGYAEAASGLHFFLRELIASKRAEPCDDLLSHLVTARDGADKLTEDELTSMGYLLVMAGYETTAHLIANTLRALLIHPRQLALLRREPERVDAVVEETLRYDPPVQNTTPYFTTEPVEYDGHTIPANQPVCFALMAANRDRRQHAQPDRFDPTRAASTHTSFGHGMHYCLGAPLARLEARIAVRALITRFPGLMLAVRPESLTRTPAVLLNALVSLPVRLG